MVSIENIKEKVIPELHDCLPAFIEDRIADWNQLRLHREQKNLEGLCRIAHKWRGFCEPYGMKELGDWAALVEDSILGGDLLKIEEPLDQIDRYMEQFSPVP